MMMLHTAHKKLKNLTQSLKVWKNVSVFTSTDNFHNEVCEYIQLNSSND